MMFFDEVGHDPGGTIEVTISVNKAQGAGIVGQDRVVLSFRVPRGSSHLHEIISAIVVNGEHFRPMLCAVWSTRNKEPKTLEILGSPGFAWLVAIHFKPINVDASSHGLGDQKTGVSSCLFSGLSSGFRSLQRYMRSAKIFTSIILHRMVAES